MADYPSQQSFWNKKGVNVIIQTDFLLTDGTVHSILISENQDVFVWVKLYF